MPVYTHLEVDYASLRLGSRIRQERKKRGWRLERLASELSVSVGTLSAIENERIALKVDLLLTIAQVLGVPLEALFPPTATRHFHIARRGAIEAQPASSIRFVSPASWTVMSYHNRLWPLAQPFVGKHIEPFELEIRPISEDELHFISHNHEEFFFVLRGRMELLIKTPDGLTRNTLGPGDCVYFWSYLPHCIRSIDKQPARSIHIVHSLQEAADSESANNTSTIYLMDASHKNIVQQIVGKIVTLRHARGMSAAEFATQVGISVQRLARIERGQSPISVELLLHICRTFRKPMEFFLSGTRMERPFSQVLRASEIRRMRVRRRQKSTGSSCFVSARFKPLSNGFPRRGMQPYLMSLGRSGDNPVKMRRHLGQEFVYVVNGSVKLITKHDGHPVDETLFPGDSCFIDGSVPHRFIEAHLAPYGRSSTEIVVVQWNPTEPRHTDGRSES